MKLSTVCVIVGGARVPPTISIFRGQFSMGLFDVDGFGESKKQETPKVDTTPSFQSNDFDRSIVDKINPLVKVEVINRHFNLGRLLRNLGIDTSRSNIYCPFHPDEATGKESAKYHEDTDLLYCFSESKMYSAYHAVKILYGGDTEKIFRDIWAKMSESERHEVMDKFASEGPPPDSTPSMWDFYRDNVLKKFQEGVVNYTQYKNALYKVMSLLDKESSSEVQAGAQ